jgi:hypothetical protein
MKTAVEWLFDQIENEGKCIYEVIKQAKEMERQQIIKAYDCTNSMAMYGEDYYNETFKSE